MCVHHLDIRNRRDVQIIYLIFDSRLGMGLAKGINRELGGCVSEHEEQEARFLSYRRSSVQGKQEKGNLELSKVSMSI